MFYGVRLNEPFYTNGCTTSSQCVFPNAIIPMSAWGTAPKRMLQYIPIGNIADGTFSSGAYKRRINDHKFGGRLDFNSNRFGTSSIYYFNDRYNLDDPYPSGLGGATLPGNGFAYDASSVGVDQTVVFSNIHTFGVNFSGVCRRSAESVRSKKSSIPFYF